MRPRLRSRSLPGRGRRRQFAAIVVCGLALSVAACGTTPTVAAPASSPARSTTQDVQLDKPASALPSGNWKLTWSANFSQPGALKRKWLFYTGGTGYGHHQLQYYDESNATVDKAGQLVISADRGSKGHTCWYGKCKYTSVRMETISTFSQTYGLFEARIKFPPGSGLWPAFWLEGTDIYKVGWPASGEVDVEESNSKNPYLITGFAHAPKFGHRAELTVPKPMTSGFHTYGVAWTPKGITWYFDGYAFGHMSLYKGSPFDKPFFIILNLAVGGGYPGSVTSSTPFPAKMVVAWVRVYKKLS